MRVLVALAAVVTASAVMAGSAVLALRTNDELPHSTRATELAAFTAEYRHRAAELAQRYPGQDIPVLHPRVLDDVSAERERGICAVRYATSAIGQGDQAGQGYGIRLKEDLAEYVCGGSFATPRDLTGYAGNDERRIVWSWLVTVTAPCLASRGFTGGVDTSFARYLERRAEPGPYWGPYAPVIQAYSAHRITESQWRTLLSACPPSPGGSLGDL